MRLEEYLENNSISVSDFAQTLGVKSRATIYRYILKDGKCRIPDRHMMEKIVIATNGKVTPSDFYNIIITKPRRASKLESEVRQ